MFYMKKTLLLMAMGLFACWGAYAQEEGGEETTPVVHTKSFLAVIEDAKFLVACPSYASGQSDLQTAIETAESGIEALADDAAVREAATALQAAIDAFIEANAPVNATEKVQNPTFDKDGNNSKTVTGWTVTNFKQNRRAVGYPSTSKTSIADFIEQWQNSANGGTLPGSGDIHQVVKNLPAGHYRLAVDVLVRNQYSAEVDDAVGVKIYLNDQERELGLTSSSADEAYNFGVDCDIQENDSLTIGFAFNETNVNWIGWDNVTLYFVGDQAAYDAIVNAEKLAAAMERLNGALTATREALEGDNPLYRSELQTAIDAAVPYLESTNPDEVNQAVDDLNAVFGNFRTFNRYYTDLKAQIEAAEALLASGQLTEGADEFTQALNKVKEDLQTTLTDYAAYADLATEDMKKYAEELTQAEATYRLRNASYANPANIITNGHMANVDGWDILVPGANPGLHINTNGDVAGFSKPFMECWVAQANAYGQENYAQQTVSQLPDGQPLPRGYYVLRAAALATRQGQSIDVTGVKLRLQDEEVDVFTGNGVSKTYTLGYEMPEDGGELTFGLYIDAATDANWIAWDEVELQFVGPKEKYLEDYAAATLGEIMTQLKQAVADAEALIESVDANGVDIEHTELGQALDEGQYLIEHPLETTAEEIEEAIKALEAGTAEFYKSGVMPKAGQTFDFTSMLVNPNFDTDATGWDVVSGELPGGSDCVNWWFGGSTTLDLVQDFQQTLTNMPAGNYLLDVNASIRVDMSYAVDNYTAEKLPNYLTMCKVYANTDSADVHPFFYIDEEKELTLEKMLLMTNDYDYRHGNGSLIDEMLKQSGLFNTLVPFTLEEEGDITVGFHLELPGRSGQMPFIDYFKLTYFGNQDITGVQAPEVQTASASTGVYNLAGQQLRRTSATNALPKGLYIVGGRKVVIR